MADDRWVQRHHARQLHVKPVADTRDGDYEDEVPSIAIVPGDFLEPLYLTWREARDLAAALLYVEGILHHG